MGAGDKEVAVHLRETQVVDTETVHAVDHVNQPILVVALTVVFIDQPRDSADRQFHTAARMHPGHAEYAGLRANVAVDGVEHLIQGNALRVVEQPEFAHPGAIAAAAEIENVAGGIVLVLGGEDFLIRAHLHAAINHRQTFGGATGEGDLAGLGLQVLAGPDPHVVLQLFVAALIPIHRQSRIAVERGAMAFDGFAHGFGVRGDQEVSEVNRLRVLIEQLAQLRPFVHGGHGRGRGHCRRCEAGAERQSGRHHTDLFQKGPAVSHGLAVS
ncbi:hypothetical protein D3C72_715990 [compost metagenome]